MFTGRGLALSEVRSQVLEVRNSFAMFEQSCFSAVKSRRQECIICSYRDLCEF